MTAGPRELDGAEAGATPGRARRVLGRRPELRPGWWGLQILTLVVLTLVIIAASSVREVNTLFRLAVDGARLETELVFDGVHRQLRAAAAADPEASLARLAHSPEVEAAMVAAPSVAPSVLHVAIYDDTGEVLAHTLPSAVGQVADPLPALPEPGNAFEVLGLIWRLENEPVDYAAEWPLVSAQDERLGVIRVVVGGTFLLHGVRETFRGTMTSAVFIVLFAAGAGAVWSRLSSRRLRRLVESVTALREGRFAETIPESGWDEFSRLARELNLLGQQFQSERAESGEEVHRAADLLGDGILLLDPELRVVFSNDIARQRIDSAEPLQPGIHVRDLLPDDHALRGLTRRLLDAPERTLTAPLRGSSSHVAVGHRIEDGGAPAGILIEIKENREQVEIHRLVDQSRVLTRLGEMAAGVAHELRGPMQGLQFDLHALEAKLDDPEAARPVIDELQERIQRLEWVLSGFLRVARIRPLQLEAVGARALLEEVRESAETEAQMAGQALVLDESDDPGAQILADRSVLRAALENLVTNALDASPSRSREVHLGHRARGDRVELWVEDDGPGIDPEVVDKVFDLYFTTKQHGSGVGLALVRQTVELHNGEVEIDSDPERGTRVALTLPMA